MKRFWLIVIVVFALGGIYIILSSSGKRPIDVTANPSVIPINQNGSSNPSVCSDITPSTTEGPYYLTSTANLVDNNLNFTKLTGTPIKVSGTVYAGSGTDKPISNAKIELWQADNFGSYHPNSNGSATSYSPDQISLRGYITTDSKGDFVFTSIYPGYYEGRARHIHVRISADGYSPVTTQIIFRPESGDGVTFNADSIAQSLPACHLLNMTDQSGTKVGSIDFRLK